MRAHNSDIPNAQKLADYELFILGYIVQLAYVIGTYAIILFKVQGLYTKTKSESQEIKIQARLMSQKIDKLSFFVSLVTNIVFISVCCTNIMK